MWREGRLKPADFCEKSPVFSQKHGGFLWKVGDLNRSGGEAAVIGDGRKAKKTELSALGGGGLRSKRRLGERSWSFFEELSSRFGRPLGLVLRGRCERPRMLWPVVRRK